MPDRIVSAPYKYLFDRFGGICREEIAFPNLANNLNPDAVPFDSERVWIGFINIGAVDLLIAPAGYVTSQRGIRLSALGGLVSFDVVNDAVMPMLGWGVYTTSIGTDLLMVVTVKRDTRIDPVRP